MSLYPEVFHKALPVTRDNATSPESLGSPQIRPNVRIKAVHYLPASIQTLNIAVPEPTSREAETNTATFSPKDPVIRIPGPPLSSGLLAKLNRKDHPQDRRVGFSPPPLRQLPVKAVALERADESATFENEEIRDKVRAAEPVVAVDRPAVLQSAQRTSTSTEKERVTVTRPASKRMTMRRLLRVKEPGSQSSAGSTLLIPTVPTVPTQSCGVRYVLGEAQLPPQFSLPAAYCQALGRPVTDSAAKEVVVQIVGRLFKQTGRFRLSQQGDTADFYALSYGEWAPVSECCSAALLVQLCKQAGGKVLCTARQCYIRHLHNFLLSLSERERLWSGSEPQTTASNPKAVSMDIQRGSHRSRSLRAPRPHSERPTPVHPRDLVFTNEKLRHLRTASDARPFDLKDCLTFQPPAASRAFSPLRLLLAKGGRRPGLAHSLEELEALWTG